MTDLAPERMAELAMQHEQYEFEQDVDKIMATLVDQPVFEFFPQGFRVEGRDAVRKMYERLVVSILPQLDTRKEVQTRDIKGFACGESALLAEIEDDFVFPDGSTKRIRMAATVHFDGEAIHGETTYLDADLATVFDSVLWTPDFIALPGVSKVFP